MFRLVMWGGNVKGGRRGKVRMRRKVYGFQVCKTPGKESTLVLEKSKNRYKLFPNKIQFKNQQVDFWSTKMYILKQLKMKSMHLCNKKPNKIINVPHTILNGCFEGKDLLSWVMSPSASKVYLTLLPKL